MVNSLDDEEEIKYRKPMNENLIFVLAVSFIFIVATSGTPYSESDNLNITSIPCHKIKGEVILKEIQEEEYLIYVELFMDNNLDGYIVTVRKFFVILSIRFLNTYEHNSKCPCRKV